MTAQLLRGKELALQIRQELAVSIKKRIQDGFRTPGLAVVIVGEDPASQVYVKHKQNAAQEIGMLTRLIALPTECSEKKLLVTLKTLNQDQSIDGILVQLPLPAHINKNRIIDAIDPKKDVDGFHPLNIGLLCQNRAVFRPCTPKGIMKLLESKKLSVTGLHAVIIGTSQIVGSPLSLELLHAGATVTLCHRKTQNLILHTQQADILISATGVPGLIQGQHIKPGAIVIDVGLTRLNNGCLVGDVDFKTTTKKAAWITPVPGGVGPMTVAMLLENTLVAADLVTL